ncbi:Glutamyl-tRNA(Gln) amidotransferase subunit C, mitochondrial [Caenorhabditis elegans]|uniref:Glutamyl-tRNA(Gln) amidotransferase subunit C, mitochondrial n=1 Tax=Caenorhabditis elegans TaxID=6239 RepID=GATC_CAEEL|nr:Glutamyl-tRNA(Gln) amidotransferase subunit C, mitochondrial [Caenorhabditis elegans]Q9BI40.1 RecName: Full=Glutamyl-tRNA(Gln) amidotransferase subunit C, mitochondrial; Short=Glu-AdT subunit C [Caenorhabditis elegans]CAC35907.1 Glutamyl-tRNA(Gln) amidotransferase subunit C, mitochondrial [Caenorhabditis elegans]|eukprot:NP_499495.1 Glutamyl-tRNA(Gln) amidotransferase subunit C, mitochondrial [Caenorhabditis elegans]
MNLIFTRIIRRFGEGKRKTPFPGDPILVPDEPYDSKIQESQLSPMPQIDAKLINHLERLSLVRFDSEQAVANLRSSIRVAKRLELVDVEGVEPMHTVWEDQECPTFEDVEEDPLPIEEVFRNASLRFDDFFVTPPGNLPLESKERFDLNVINEWDTIGKPVAPEVKLTRMTERKK